ncbi:hypothetical protein [Thiomicrospira sp. XS5]|uniref:hypothetical protein n=1 Tax=Thiomicrospira sp. XS5 TaxID=1775636 RepID=UPI001365C834|nr:hypothetical protein [Thiomicrospira sp. XS5]
MSANKWSIAAVFGLTLEKVWMKVCLSLYERMFGLKKASMQWENKRSFGQIWYNVIDLQESGVLRDDYKSLVVYHFVDDSQLVCAEVGRKALSHRLGVSILGGRDFGRNGFLLYDFRLVRVESVMFHLATSFCGLAFFGMCPQDFNNDQACQADAH